MAEIDRLSGSTGWIELDFVEKEETPRELMRLGIKLHLAGSSLAETTSILDEFGIDRCRSTVHNWVRKADLRPEPSHQPEQIAVDETVVTINDQRYWLFAAVDPATNRFLHVRLFSTRTTALAQLFLSGLKRRYDLSTVEFLVDGAPWLHAALYRHGLEFQHVTHGDRNSVERVFKEVKRRTERFANHFRNADRRRRIVAPSLRRLLESANLNSATGVGTHRFIVIGGVRPARGCGCCTTRT
jgi:transposase-like protein